MLKTFSYMAYFLIGFGFLVIVVLSFFMPQYIDSNFTEGAGIGNNIKMFLVSLLPLICFSALVLPFGAMNKRIELIHRIVIFCGFIIWSYMIYNLTKEILDPNKIRYVPFLVDLFYYALWLLLFWKVLKLFRLLKQKKSIEAS